MQQSLSPPLTCQGVVHCQAAPVCWLQRYTYITFPSETITRSGYQIRRKNFAVAAARRGSLYCLVASARGDQYSPEKEQNLRHIIDSFRLNA